MATYPGVPVYGGDIISADDIVANIPIVYVKEASETRNNTSALANDAELVNIPLQVGVYEIELELFWQQATSTTPAFKTQWAFSGTWNAPMRACFGAGQDNVAPTNRATTVYTLGVPTSSNAIYSADTTANYNMSRELSRQVIVTAAGNLSLQWAQNTATVANTICLVGTSFTVRKISS